MSITFKAIFEEVSHNQFNILKQILQVHDKIFAKQLANYQQQ